MRIPDAPKTAQGFFEARPGDIAGRADLMVIDVRDEAELISEVGHIHAVVHRPMADLLAQGLPDVEVSTPVVLVCHSGRRSAACAAYLVEKKGFFEVYNLVGGMVRWGLEGRPTARARTWK